MCKKHNYILGSVIKIFLAGQESQTVLAIDVLARRMGHV